MPDSLSIRGCVERIVFNNPDNQYTVFRMSSTKQETLITVVGHSLALQAGHEVQCTGQWKETKQYGRQFHADIIQPDIPHSSSGLIKYLSSSSTYL